MLRTEAEFANLAETSVTSWSNYRCRICHVKVWSAWQESQVSGIWYEFLQHSGWFVVRSCRIYLINKTCLYIYTYTCSNKYETNMNIMSVYVYVCMRYIYTVNKYTRHTRSTNWIWAIKRHKQTWRLPSRSCRSEGWKNTILHRVVPRKMFLKQFFFTYTSVD